jgi:hypothetical protein
MSVGYFLSNLVGHLPLLGVLVAGFVLVSARRQTIGARSASLARLGLVALLVSVILQLAWAMVIPQLMDTLESATRFGVAASIIGIILAVSFAAGVALILAAVVTRTPSGPAPPYGPGDQFIPSQTYIPAPDPTQPHNVT